MADDREPAELSEDSKERYRCWWLSRSPDERARLRSLNGKPVTPHELVLLPDSEGFLLTGSSGAPDGPAVFSLPDFLLHDDADRS